VMVDLLAKPFGLVLDLFDVACHAWFPESRYWATPPVPT
jgi:hypothetical protein